MIKEGLIPSSVEEQIEFAVREGRKRKKAEDV